MVMQQATRGHKQQQRKEEDAPWKTTECTITVLLRSYCIPCPASPGLNSDRLSGGGDRSSSSSAFFFPFPLDTCFEGLARDLALGCALEVAAVEADDATPPFTLLWTGEPIESIIV